MLSAAAIAVAARLVASLMTLARAVSPIALGGGTPTFSELAAHALFERLSRLVAALVRLTTEGPRHRAHARPGPATPTRTPAAPTTPTPLRTEKWRLRTEPGWLLHALPGTAPAIAADLEALLADPALAALLDAEPSLRRTLNPLLRCLGLTPLPIPAAPPPSAAPPAAPNPPPNPPHPPSHPPSLQALAPKSSPRSQGLLAS